jgi:hypothetical protein
MKDLIKRLQQESASFVLDGEVAKAVGVDLPVPPAYTVSVDKARDLIPARYSFGCGDVGEQDASWACVTSPDGTDYTCKFAATPAMALSAAALMARDALS